ncbi:hypothetical protein SAMN05216358_4221 [Rhizobium sp. AN5]|uniref:hypothetical protein n=1 Tax=Rhizobium sp. AN5 TaxID=1855304 RepID=UPI000BDA3757|nr:hypothetical protein [Rhizobium sp. AN5]SOC94021.1 hypothetical protein SAMN05216358_4221 [Rhizobium sp. AN5]
MRISERIDAATEAFKALDFANANAADLQAIADRFRLNDPQFQEAAMTAISERVKASELKQIELDARRVELVSKAKEKGARQAEVEILNSPLPWSREKLVAMVELVEDWFISEVSRDDDDEFTMDLVCEVTNGARVGFIERVVELSATSFPEVQA